MSLVSTLLSQLLQRGEGVKSQVDLRNLRLSLIFTGNISTFNIYAWGGSSALAFKFIWAQLHQRGLESVSQCCDLFLCCPELRYKPLFFFNYQSYYQPDKPLDIWSKHYISQYSLYQSMATVSWEIFLWKIFVLCCHWQVMHDWQGCVSSSL